MRFQRILPFIFLLAGSFGAGAQTLSKNNIIKSVTEVADNVVKNTTYMYYDIEEGVFIHDIASYGYMPGNIIPQNPYNDWKYWNGVLHLGFNRLGELTSKRKFAEYTARNFEFLFRDFDYFKSIYTGGAQWTHHMAQAVDITELDDCGAMGASLIELYLKDPRPEYKKYIDDATELMMSR